MLGLTRHGCLRTTSLVPGFLWGNSPLTLRLPPCPRLTPRLNPPVSTPGKPPVWPVPYACAQPYNSGSGHSRPQSPSFLGQIKPSGSGDEKGKWRPWRESCFALIATHHHGPMNTALILQGSEGYAILMSLNEKHKSCPWLPLLG